MKKLIMGAVLVSSLIACKNQEKNKADNYAVISGKVLPNENNEPLRLFVSRDSIIEIKSNADGTFRDTINNINSQNYFYLIVERKALPIYLEKGTVLDVDFTKDILNPQLSGSKYQNTQYLTFKRQFVENFDGADNNLFGQKPQEFKSNIKSTFEGLTKKLDSFGFDSKFTQNEKKWINYYIIDLLESYPKYNELLTQNAPNLPDDFFAEKENINYDNAEDYQNLSIYKEMVQKRLFQMVEDPENTEQIQLLLNELKSLKSDNIKEDIANSLIMLIAPKGKNNDLIYNFINENIKSDKIKNKTKEIYEGLKRIVEGAVSPSFNYENYNGGKTSLEDLRGKIVYIDVWATWCGPCRAEIPHLKQLEQDFHGKNIAFVSISVDDVKNHDKWKEFVAKNELSGIQLFADNAWKSKFVEEYMINGIPRFILLDKEGKIINADAPRPSDPETKKLLNNLL